MTPSYPQPWFKYEDLSNLPPGQIWHKVILMWWGQIRIKTFVWSSQTMGDPLGILLEVPSCKLNLAMQVLPGGKAPPWIMS